MIPWWSLLIFTAIFGLIAGLIADRSYERGLHLGVTWPQRASALLTRHGQDMRYMMDKFPPSPTELKK
jgi:hypothetical protein